MPTHPTLASKTLTEYRTYSGNHVYLRDYELPTPPEVIPLSPPPTERVLTASVVQGTKKLQVWPISGQVDIKVSIELRTPLHAGVPAFPEDRVEWHGDSKHLQVHMFELGQKPVNRTLLLFRTGSSSVVTFNHDADVAEIDLRFIISDGAQLLQTARLQASGAGRSDFSLKLSLHRWTGQKQGSTSHCW